MTKIDIKECEGGGAVEGGRSSKSPSPARREAGLPLDATDKTAKTEQNDQTKNSDKNREGVSNESGYFEDEEDSSSLQHEDSIEIIFDKNASNNNSGQSSAQTGRNFIFLKNLKRALQSSLTLINGIKGCFTIEHEHYKQACSALYQ